MLKVVSAVVTSTSYCNIYTFNSKYAPKCAYLCVLLRKITLLCVELRLIVEMCVEMLYSAV